MKYTQFKVQNFKGIEDITIQLDKSPEANVYALVGLNESGKTTILEAINFFSVKEDLGRALELPGATRDYNSIIPVSKRDNFNGQISLEVTLQPDADDLKKISQYAAKHTQFKALVPPKEIRYYRYYKYKDSKFIDAEFKWSGFQGFLAGKDKPIVINDTEFANDNGLISAFCNSLLPSILYFPNFLFDFPSKIYLQTEAAPTEKEKFYIELIQDVLSSLGNDSNIQTHLIDRIKSDDLSDKRNLNSILQKMSRKLTEVIFEAWNIIFKRELKDTRVAIDYSIGSNHLPYLEFNIEAQDGIYHINERSLGFRWFFIFLLFTQFRPFRKDRPSNVIFLFDEPASNLHSSAQIQLLKSFENLTKTNKIIYTTHSHHLINPNWLESTYVVKNDGLKLEDPINYNIKKTSISIEAYREFVINHPHNTAYFQPILDVLDYAPSDLEMVPSCVFLEGKNDFYSLAYFHQVIFQNQKKLNLAPSTGSGNLDVLLSLYLGWGKNFIVLLDSDKAGEKEKARYVERFGEIVRNRIFCLSNIDPSWTNIELEKLYDATTALQFFQTFYPEETKYSKTQFHRLIQENLACKRFFQFDPATCTNFQKALNFLADKIVAVAT